MSAPGLDHPRAYPHQHAGIHHIGAKWWYTRESIATCVPT